MANLTNKKNLANLTDSITRMIFIQMPSGISLPHPMENDHKTDLWNCKVLTTKASLQLEATRGSNLESPSALCVGEGEHSRNKFLLHGYK